MKQNQATIRIKDIAEKAQVSVGTVDRVLHNRGKVSEEVKEKINKIIKELNYEPNLIARTLGTNKTYVISVLLPNPDNDQYWFDCKTGIESAFKELKGYGITITFYYFDSHKFTSFLEKATEVTQSSPDGILIAPLFFRESLAFFYQWDMLKIPYITINTQIQEAHPLSYIGQDSYQSGKLAAQLLHYGAADSSTIAIIHIEEDIANSAHLIFKEKGFRDYFEENSQTNKAFNIITADLPNPNHITFSEKIAYLLAENPDLRGAYVTTSKAFEIANYFKKRDIKGIRLVGYDLLKKNIDFLNTGLIDFLINQNPRGQGYFGILGLTEKLAFKKDVQPIKYLPLDIVTKENAQYYLQ